MSLTMRSGDVAAFLALPLMADGPGVARQEPSKSALTQWLSGHDRDVALFTAHRDGRVAGRILVHAPRFNVQRTAASFALFDCTDDPDVARHLLEVATSWARARGLGKIVGPVDLADLPALGVNTDMPPRFLKEYGFAQAGVMTRYRIDPTAVHLPEISPAAQAILDDPDFKLAPQSKALQPQRLSEAMAVLNEGLGQIAPFMPALQVAGVQRTDPALCLVLLHKGRPVGCNLALPDQANEGPKTTLARIWPQFDRLTRLGRSGPQALTILSGVLPQFQTPAIGQLLWGKAILALRAGGYADVSTHCTANLHGLDITQPGVTLLERLHLFSKAV